MFLRPTGKIRSFLSIILTGRPEVMACSDNPLEICRNFFIAVFVVFILIGCNGDHNGKQIYIMSPAEVLSPVYTLFGKLEKGEGELVFQLNGGNFRPLPTNKDHSFLTNFTLRAGANEILLELRDGDVMLSRLNKKVFLRDKMPPVVGISTNSNNAYAGDKVTLSAFAVDNDELVRVDIYHNGKLVRHGNNSLLNQSFVLGLNKLGDHHFKMDARDASFNKASAELSIRVIDGSDLIGLQMISPQVVYASDYFFQVMVKSLKSIAAGTVRLNSGPPLDLRSNGGDLEQEVALKPGWNSLVVEVRDINGGAMAREFNVYYTSFVGLASNDERLVALRPLVEDIYFSYGLSDNAPAISRTRALRDWVARHVVHPDSRFHPNGSTANSNVLAAGNSWATVNAVLNDAKISADQEFWADYKYDGYAMLDTLLGTLNRQSGYRRDDGLMEQVARGHFRIRDIRSFRYAYCTYQAAVLQVLWASAGFQSMMLSSNGHDPAVVFIPNIGWVYSDPTFNEELRVSGRSKPLTILEILESIKRDDRKNIFPLKGIDENRSGPLWDTEQYIAPDVTYLKVVPSGFSYLRALMNSFVLGGSSNREVVTISGSRDPWPGPIVLADEAFRAP